MSELSSNWKTLQAMLNTGKQTRRPSLKRRAEEQKSSTIKTRKCPKETATRTTEPLNAEVKRIAKMGGVQSSKAVNEGNIGQSPSIALWATDQDISTEALAEAYGLGLKGNMMSMTSHKDKVNHGRSSEVEVGKYVGVDCEMVGIGPGGHESALARVSLVDFHGRQIYDSYVKPEERVTDWRTAVSGVSQKEMRFARKFEDVQSEVCDIIEGRILVGHDIKHDLDALKLSHPFRDIRDTAKHRGFKNYSHGRKPALRVLARELLAVDIQEGPHSSTEDARVTMLIFRKFKSSFDVDHANRYTQRSTPNIARKSKKHRRKH
ncbi:RNA exonuclease 4 [Metarhizium rileyi]|uniref:RNA exonuclease 4 n=1 Tax=Metarhizium rileyi (strain RCEF 4871) TaxID=1649241 RepID=A0A167G8M2_METRR|nr:RNA exonuclease 4 [Metarhizium rileyi RCEF 4871]